MTTTHDLIVVGAGPAGSAAALTAVRAGLRVALIDKAAFPRDKLCGGGITGRSRRHLHDIFGTGIDEGLFRTCRHMRLTEADRVLADLPSAPPIWMTMRRDFDAALLDMARAAGCEAITGLRITELALDDGRVGLADGKRLCAPVVLGADGANSAVARALFGRAHDPARIGFGLEAELPLAEAAGPVVDIDLAGAAWGYGWAFPKQGSLTVGVGGVHRRNADLRGSFERAARRYGADPARLRVKGAFLPFGEVRRIPGRGSVLLAGDAAGLVDPITGEGIAWAMRSGQLAALAAAGAIAAGRPEQALARYRRSLRPVQSELSRARVLRAMIYHPWLNPAFLRFVERSPGLQRRYLDLLSGDLDYADLGWRALPRLVLRMVRRGVC